MQTPRLNSACGSGEGTRPKRDRIVLLGWYGSNNTGDEAIVQVIVEGLRSRGFCNVVVLSIDPVKTQQKLGVKSVPRNLFQFDALRELIVADALILGGGGLIQDGTSVYNLLIYSAYVALARMLGVKVIGWGLGAELLITPLGRKLARFICHSSAHFSVRDTGSGQALVSAGVSSLRLKVTTDPATALKPEKHHGSWPDDGRPTVIFCVRHLPVIRPGINPIYFLPVSIRHRLGIEWRHAPGRIERVTQSLAQAIRVAVNELGARVVLLPLWPGRDEGMIDVVEEAALQLRVPAEAMQRAPLHRTPGQYFSYIGRADLLVSMRLHALIFGLMQGVPSLAVSYAGKVRNQMREFGAERWTVDIERHTPAPEEISMNLRRLWKQRESERRSLRKSASRARHAAEADADEIAVVLRQR